MVLIWEGGDGDWGGEGGRGRNGVSWLLIQLYHLSDGGGGGIYSLPSLRWFLYGEDGDLGEGEKRWKVGYSFNFSISQATVGAASRSRRYCTVHSTTVQYYVNITLDLGDVTS